MREIKFRGKRTDNGEWAFGCLEKYSEDESIIVSDLIEQKVYWVKTETVGQYTGMRDKNGKPIYDGDIVNNGKTIVYSSGNSMIFESIGVVRFDVKNGCIVINNTYGYNKRLTEKTIKLLSIEVIGNIHENNSQKLL